MYTNYDNQHIMIQWKWKPIRENKSITIILKNNILMITLNYGKILLGYLSFYS